MMQASWPIKLQESKLREKWQRQETRHMRNCTKKLETKERENEVFKIAKQRNRQSKDVQQVRVIKNKTGEILMEEERVKQRWKQYFDKLLNHENPRERRGTRTEGRERDVEDISGEEVRTEYPESN